MLFIPFIINIMFKKLKLFSRYCYFDLEAILQEQREPGRQTIKRGL